MEFKDNLRYFRKQSGLTRPELAEALGLSASIIGGYENNTRKPSFEVLVAMSDVLNISVDSLLGKNSLPEKQIDPVVLDIAASISSNKELLKIVRETPSSEKCRNCVIVQYLSEIIVKLTSQLP